MTTKSANYKLARQAILMAYELLVPDPRSVDDLKRHLTILQSTEHSEREVFYETMAAFDEGLKGKWFYRD